MLGMAPSAGNRPVLGTAPSTANFDGVVGRECATCKIWKPQAAYSKNQLRLCIGKSVCAECLNAEWQVPSIDKKLTPMDQWRNTWNPSNDLSDKVCCAACGSWKARADFSKS